MCAWGRVGRHWVSIAVAILLLATGCLTPRQFIEGVNWDVIGLVLGMGVMTAYLELSGAMDLATRFLRRRVASPTLLVFTLFMAAGLVSVALENVSVTLLFAPIAARIASELGMDIAPVVIGVALASNLSGSATMIGDPPAIMTAGYFNLAFTDFIVYRGRPSMFFYTIAAMVVACAVTSVMVTRGSAARIASSVREARAPDPRIDTVFVYEALGFLGLKIALLSVRHIVEVPLSLAAAVAVGGTTIARLLHGDRSSVRRAFREGADWRLALFLVGVFAVSKAFASTGLARLLAVAILSHVGRSLTLVTTALVWISVAASAFMDNVPYTATMLPVVSSIARALRVDPVPLAWAMLLGTTLGGNLTFIGASANVTAVRYLERKGIRVSFSDFLKISAPFNTASVVTGWLLFEAVWGF
ncbi:MAG: citrate transporter [Crenarchaeota archaeon]|nr:citrate transporter [Thermoproteota archaeon]